MLFCRGCYGSGYVELSPVNACGLSKRLHRRRHELWCLEEEDVTMRIGVNGLGIEAKVFCNAMEEGPLPGFHGWKTISLFAVVCRK